MAKCWLPIFIFAAIVLACFGRTLGSYFVADDFTQVAYVAAIFKGNWNALFSSFTGNYMQIPVMKIYRPCLLVSLVVDYFFWGVNAFGYFLTNILFLIGAAVMLYFLLKEMTASWQQERSTAFAVLSAALFASSPLHCESISFISGRDSIIAALFYLLSLWCFVRKGPRRNIVLLIGGVLSFWLAMLSKEVAIGLPVVLAGMAFFLPELFGTSKAIEPNESVREEKLLERFIFAMRVSCALWLTTIVYFFVRYLSLGTFTGGYTGGLGAGLMTHLGERWSSLGTLVTIFYPLNLDAFGLATPYQIALSLLYLAVVLSAAIRCGKEKVPWRWLGFLVLWLLTTVAPLYQLWGLSQNLAGARFMFFLTIPLSVFAPLLMFAPEKKTRATDKTFADLDKYMKIGILVLGALVLLDTNITYINNIPWLHAGGQTRACLVEGQKLAASLAADHKIVLLGLPKDEGGAHMIYNGTTFNVMMAPPFAKTDVSEKFITFDPLFYGPAELVNTQRLKSILSEANVVGLTVWDEKAKKFQMLWQPIPLTPPDDELVSCSLVPESVDANLASPEKKTSNVWMHDCTNGYGLLIAPLSINPYRFDFIELTLRSGSPKQLVSIFWRGLSQNDLRWHDAKDPAKGVAIQAGTDAKLRIRLSDHWRWFTQGDINQLRLDFLPGHDILLEKAELVPGNKLMPILNILNLSANNLGVYAVDGQAVSISYDGSKIHGCAKVKIEISKPNYFFEGLSNEQLNEAILTSVIQPLPAGNAKIDAHLFASPGYYQLRAVCLDDNGAPTGEGSDPVTVRI